MPVIHVKYFASLREKAGTSGETVEFSGKLSELYSVLSEKHGFDLPFSSLQVAMNDEFTSLHEEALPDSRIVFIPPVAGG